VTTPRQRADTPHLPASGDLVINPTQVPADRRHLIPEFGAPVWPITFTSDNPSVAQRQIHWATFPTGLREQFRHAAWALLNIPIPDRHLAGRSVAMRARLSILRVHNTIDSWRTLATWLDGREISTLADVSTQVLTDYSIYLAKTRKLARNTAVSQLVALTRLHLCALHLPASMRIGVPPWENEGFDDYLPAATTTGENATEPISPATMGPLLVWALKFVEEFAVDILTARTEHQRLREIVAAHRDHPRRQGPPPALTTYLNEVASAGGPLPTRPQPGPGFAPSAATAYIAAITNSPLGSVQRALKKPHWRRHLATHPDGPSPLDVAITGTIDSAPWVDSINYYDVEPLTRHLATACFVVIAYLTGMRVSEKREELR
jgi:hypothetical protein